MFEKREFPILEFDCNPKAKIEPVNVVTKMDVPECCVITFFGDVIHELLQSNKLKQIATFYTATVHLPIYETEYDGKTIAITQGFLGAAGSAAQLEELIVMGFSKFIVCGAAGVLQKGIQVGHLVIPYAAVRDEVYPTTMLRLQERSHAINMRYALSISIYRIKTSLISIQKRGRRMHFTEKQRIKSRSVFRRVALR